MPPKKKGSGKKKKGPKKSKSAVAKEKLNKAVDEYEKSGSLKEEFVERINEWIRSNHGRAIDLFRKFDVDGDCTLSYDEFQDGMRDLNAPCTAVELQILAKLLDSDGDGSIDYREFSRGVRYFKAEDIVPDDGLPILKIQREELEKCEHCKIKLWRSEEVKYPRFICVDVRLITFLRIQNYPGHFRIYIHSHVKVQGLVNMINDRHGDTLRYVRIYHEKQNGERVPLDPYKTFEEHGLYGGPKTRPQHLELLYDYATEFHDCPILMCDDYFTYENPKKSAAGLQ